MKVPLLIALGAGAALAASSELVGWYEPGPARGPVRLARAPQDSAPAPLEPGEVDGGTRAALDGAVSDVQARVKNRLNASVFQEGSPTPQLWWFDGEDASSYSESVTLQAVSGKLPLVPPLHWKVVEGQDKVRFANGIDEIVTFGPSVQVFSTGASSAAPTVTRDIAIRMEDVHGHGTVYRMVVYAPHHLVKNAETHLAGQVGYVTEVSYTSEDQFNQVLPFVIEVAQDWGPETSDFPGENWPWRPEFAAFVMPASWVDVIDRDAEGLFTNPPVQKPGMPLGATPVDHRSGHLRHGSSTTVTGPDNNPGRIVHSLIWQTYQDHARHE